MGELMYDIDPELVPWLSTIPTLDRTDPAGARKVIAEMTAKIQPYESRVPLSITNVSAPGLGAGPDVPIRLFRDSGREVVPAILWIHGGGFTLGSVDLDANTAAEVAAETGCLVASVEYRLAPEDRYPAGLDDCYAALCWLHENAESLGVDPSRIVVAGESAGGGLAAAVTLRARDFDGPPIAFQFLFVPELDDRLETASMLRYTDTPVWHRPNAILSWRQYLGERFGTDDVPAYAAPARATDLSGLPPAYVVVCEFDPLRDEGAEYALALVRSGVHVELHLYPGTFHGSTLIATAEISRRMRGDRLDSFRRILT